MSLSVSSATSALAALQALSAQAAGAGATSSTPASASPSSTASPTTRDTTSVAGGDTLGLYALVQGAGQAATAADAADAAGQSVLGLLQQLRARADTAADPATSTASRASLDAGFQAIAAQIGPTLAAAGVNGVNLVDGSLDSGLKVALGDGTSASLMPADLTLGGPTLRLSADASVATATAAASAFSTLGAAIGATGSALDTLRGQADQIGAHVGFVQSLGQALAAPADDSGDSVRLLALQVSQQLSVQSGAVANASPQSILSLFRS